MIGNLRTYLAEQIDIPPAEIEVFIGLSKIRELRKGHYYIREGETPQRLAFVIEGLFRYVYLSERGDEFTKSFIPAGSFLSSYSAMVQNRGSAYFVEALEDSKILEIRYQDWLRLLEANKPVWQQLLLQILEKGFIKKEARERAFLLDDAETRYQTFLDNYPGLESRIPQRMVASYIGIQPESLSRIRKKREA